MLFLSRCRTLHLFWLNLIKIKKDFLMNSSNEQCRNLCFSLVLCRITNVSPFYMKIWNELCITGNYQLHVSGDVTFHIRRHFVRLPSAAICYIVTKCYRILLGKFNLYHQTYPSDVIYIRGQHNKIGNLEKEAYTASSSNSYLLFYTSNSSIILR